MPREQRKPASGVAESGGGEAALGGLDLDLDDDLDSLFAEALAATEKRVARRPAAARQQPPPQRRPVERAEPADEVGDASLHFLIDEALDDDVSFDTFGRPRPAPISPGTTPPDMEPPPGPEPWEEAVAEADDPGGEADASGNGGDVDSIDDLEHALRAALEDDEEEGEDDLQSEMERLLAESYDLGGELPEIEEEDEDEEILAAGDDGVHVLTRSADEEIGKLRGQVAEMSRTLSLRDLELRTAEERIEALESQLVATARQSANIGRDFEAFRRRAERDRAELERFAGEKIVKELLGVYDNLWRALEHACEQRKGPLGEGVEMILGQFLVALRRCGTERVDVPPGTPFDPSFHEAVGQEHSDVVPAGHVLAQLQAGFTMNGRLIRAAVVQVSQGPLAAPSETQASPRPLAEAPADLLQAPADLLLPPADLPQAPADLLQVPPELRQALAVPAGAPGLPGPSQEQANARQRRSAGAARRARRRAAPVQVDESPGGVEDLTDTIEVERAPFPMSLPGMAPDQAEEPAAPDPEAAGTDQDIAAPWQDEQASRPGVDVSEETGDGDDRETGRPRSPARRARSKGRTGRNQD